MPPRPRLLPQERDAEEAAHSNGTRALEPCIHSIAIMTETRATQSSLTLGRHDVKVPRLFSRETITSEFTQLGNLDLSSLELFETD